MRLNACLRDMISLSMAVALGEKKAVSSIYRTRRTWPLIQRQGSIVTHPLTHTDFAVISGIVLSGPY